MGRLLTNTPVDLVDYWHRTGRIVRPPVHAGSRHFEGDRSCPLGLVGQSSDRILAGEGIERVVVRRSFGMVVVDRTALVLVDSPAEEGSPDSDLVAGSLGCSLVGRIDRMDLT